MHDLPYISTLADGGILAWLLGLDRVDPTDPTVVLSWQHHLPAWAWALVIIAIGAVAWISYRRMLGRRSGRIALAGGRSLLLLLLVLLLAGPMLVLPRENVEEDHVLMLLDRSASMSVKDAPGDIDPRQSRDQHLRRLLAQNRNVWQRLEQDHQIDWLTFGEQLAQIADPTVLQDAAGRTTALRTALQEAVRRAAGKPISGVVVFSDGRSSEPTGPEVWNLLRQMGVEVWAVPLGSPEPPLDLALQRIDAPDRAFVNDTVPIAVTVSRTGSTGDEPPPPGARVKLVDQTTGEVLDEKPLESFNQPVRLMTTPKAAGQATWRVELVGGEEELIEENNTELLEVDLVARPIRVLYVEGYPRWEYRYLKTLIVREASVQSSIMLISADRTFAQEGNIPLRRLPRTKEELKDYDVLIIGDVPAGFFSAEQLRLIQEQVAQEGAGLMWLGGTRDTPGSYATSPLSSLLPIAGSTSLSTLPAPIVFQPSPVAESLGVLRLRSTDPNDTSTWPADLPPLLWAQAVEDLKPAAEVLAFDKNSKSPLIVRMRFGAGQTLYVASDEMWRWRYGRGDLYGDQFWMQLIRLLARGRLQAGSGPGDRAMLLVSHRRAATGDTLVLEVKIADQTLLQGQGDGPQRLEVEVTPVNDTNGGRTSGGQVVTLSSTTEPGLYRGTWSPRIAGRFNLRVISPALADLGLMQNVNIERSDDELRYPATDHALLAELADRTGGGMLAPEQVDQLPQRLANRARRTAADISEELTHSPLVFALLLGLLTIEWVGRRVLGLA